MYHVIIAEDEPPILRYLKKIVETKCPGFQVVATAEDGQEAFEKVRFFKPDLVLTDAKMPILDGIELISKIKREYPDILTVVISGYQNFSYVKHAFQAGSQEYLLKPVQPSEMSKLFDSLKEKLDNFYHEKRQNELEKAMFCQQYADERNTDIWANLLAKGFSVAILRKNGIPSRFLSNRLIEPSLLENFNTNNLQCLFSSATDVWHISGRDTNEIVFVFVWEEKQNQDFCEIFKNIINKLDTDHAYYTVVYDDNLVPLCGLKEAGTKLFQTLDQHIILGKNQILCLNAPLPVVSEVPMMDSSMINNFEYLSVNREMCQMKQQLIQFFSNCEKEEKPQIWIEKIVYQMLDIIQKNAIPSDAAQIIEAEKMLDEVFYYSVSFGELMTGAWDVIDSIMSNYQTENCQKKNAKDLLSKIEQYLNKNLTEQFTLQSVADNFGISQTYLSRLFRRYKNTSFNEYVTNLRIDAAKKIMRENPDILLKDVATIVGYRDFYYFSKVFKSVTGFPPSAFNDTKKQC